MTARLLCTDWQLVLLCLRSLAALSQHEENERWLLAALDQPVLHRLFDLCLLDGAWSARTPTG